MAVRTTERATLAAMVLLAAATGHAAAAGRGPSQPAAAPSEPTPFVATYTIAWHGVTAGTSTLQLRKTAPQSYLYTSTDEAYGIFRLAFPHPLRQSSRSRRRA